MEAVKLIFTVQYSIEILNNNNTHMTVLFVDWKCNYNNTKENINLFNQIGLRLVDILMLDAVKT